MMQRAKEPAKVHSIGRPVSEVPTPSSSPGNLLGGPPMQASSPNVSPCGATAAPMRPPRPKRAPGSGGSGTPSKPSENRRPRPGSEPSARRSPSEPPQGREGVGAPKAKARASSVSRARIGDAPPPVERKDVGKVPAYLKRRQHEMAEEKRIADRPPSPKAPPGYRKVPEEERQATLEVLRQRKTEAEKAQRNLPFKIETAGQKQREKTLVDRLAHLDKLLGMFGEQLVFIPANAEPIARSIPPLDANVGEGTPATAAAAAAAVVAEGAAGVRKGAERGGMQDVMRRSNSVDAGGKRQSSREGRAQASAERRQQLGAAAPWEQLHGIDAPSRAVRTEVKVAAPPGGRSNLSLGWD